MKKIFTLGLALTAFIVSSFGQCVPNTSGFAAGQYISPNSLPGILQNSAYSGVMSILVPDSLPGRDFGNPAVAAFTITIDSVQFTSITGTPNGITANPNPTLGGAWTWAGGYSCITFAGTTSDPIGNYPLTVSGVGCGHFTLPVIGTRVDSCMPFNFSSVYPYDLQVCNVQCTNTYDTTYQTICRGDSVLWGNTYERRTGQYVDTALQSIGCDSLHILFLTSLNPAISRDSAVGCGSVSYGGNTYANDTAINTVIPGGSVNGCDSIVRTNIVVGGAIPTITSSSDTLTANDPAAAAWQWLENGTAISGANSATYVVSGSTNSYSVAVIDVHGCVDTSAVLAISGITGIAVQSIKLYPNPNNGTFIMATHNAKGTAYTISNTLGQIVSESVISADQQAIDLGNVSTGVYTISMKGIDPIQFTVTK
jgi:hypothetical protein